MDIKKQLEKGFSKMNSVKISLYVGADADRFAELMSYMLGDDRELSRRAAWAVSFCFENHPFLFDAHVEELVNVMASKKYHDAVKRTATQALQYMEIPEDLEGPAYDNAIAILNDTEEPIAVKAYSMSILEKIALKFPELKQEVILIVENQIPYSSAGYKSRGTKLLKKLKERV